MPDPVPMDEMARCERHRPRYRTAPEEYIGLRSPPGNPRDFAILQALLRPACAETGRTSIPGMRALVVYDTKFGNTKQIAQAISDVLGERDSTYR